MANTQYNFKKSIFEYDTIGRAVVEVTAISSGEENVVGSGEVENGDIVFAVDNKNTPTAVRLYIKNPFGEAYGKDGELLGVGTDVDHINVSNDATVGANLNVSGNTTLEGAVNIRSDVYIGEEYDLSSALSAIKIETETNTNNKIINGYSTPIHLTSDKLGEVNYPRFDIDWEPDQRTFTVGTANTTGTSGWDISKLIVTDQGSNAGISIISTRSGNQMGPLPYSRIKLTPGTIDVDANRVNISGSILNTNGSSTFVEYITSPKIVSGKTYQLFLGYRQDISGNTVPHEISMLCREDGETDKYPVWFHSDGTGHLESDLYVGGNLEVIGRINLHGESGTPPITIATGGTGWIDSYSFVKDSSDVFVYNGVIPRGFYVVVVQRGAADVQSFVLYKGNTPIYFPVPRFDGGTDIFRLRISTSDTRISVDNTGGSVPQSISMHSVGIAYV